MIPTITFDFILNSDQRELKIYSMSIIGLPTFILEGWMLRKVNNEYGVINEYKMMLLLIIFYYGGLGLTSCIPTIDDTYYQYIIDFLSKWILTSAYFIWLVLYLKTFSVENLDSIGAASGKKFTSRILRMAPRLSDKYSNEKLDEKPLHAILSNEKWYKQFRQHVQE